MPQITKVIDVTRSFIPVDPNSFPENLMYTEREDSPEKEPPILAFEGANFLPTSYGYRSYFGTNSTLQISPLPSRCDTVLLFQLANYRNVLIALCEDGIYYAPGDVQDASWTKGVDSPSTDPNVYKQWTYALIENTLYFYRQGEDKVWKLGYEDFVEETPIFTAGTPLTFINLDDYSYVNGIPLAPTGSGTLANPYIITSELSDYYIRNGTPNEVVATITLEGLNLGDVGTINIEYGLADATSTTTYQLNTSSSTLVYTVTIPPFTRLYLSTLNQNHPNISGTIVVRDSSTNSDTFDTSTGYIPVSLEAYFSDTTSSITGIGTQDNPFTTTASNTLNDLYFTIPPGFATEFSIDVSSDTGSTITLYDYVNGQPIISGTDISGTYTVPSSGLTYEIYSSNPFTLNSLILKNTSNENMQSLPFTYQYPIMNPPLAMFLHPTDYVSTPHPAGTGYMNDRFIISSNVTDYRIRNGTPATLKTKFNYENAIPGKLLLSAVSSGGLQNALKPVQYSSHTPIYAIGSFPIFIPPFGELRVKMNTSNHPNITGVIWCYDYDTDNEQWEYAPAGYVPVSIEAVFNLNHFNDSLSGIGTLAAPFTTNGVNTLQEIHFILPANLPDVIMHIDVPNLPEGSLYILQNTTGSFILASSGNISGEYTLPMLGTKWILKTINNSAFSINGIYFTYA